MAVATRRKKLAKTNPPGHFIATLEIEPVEMVGKVESAADVIGVVKKGLKVESLDRLQSELDISSAQLRETVKISASTLRRRRASGRLNPEESERVYRLGKLFLLASKVLGTDELASQWFKSSKKAFGGATPLEYADTEIGKQEIEKLLYRIAYGVFA